VRPAVLVQSPHSRNRLRPLGSFLKVELPG
jgi:hypothetical protein